MRRYWLVFLLLALVLAILAWWPRSVNEREREPEPASEAAGDVGAETRSERTEAPTSVESGASVVLPSLSLAEALRALAAQRPDALDFARAEVDLRLAQGLRQLVRERRATAAELLEALDAFDPGDPARAAGVLALAWTEGDPSAALERLTSVATMRGTDSAVAEQCALAAVRALAFAGARESLASLVANEIAPGGELEVGLRSVRVWLALRELSRVPDVLAEALLTASGRELPRRIAEEAWAAAARSGDATWSDALWRAIDSGDEAALEGLAHLRERSLEPALLDLHARSAGWPLLAAQRSLASLATDASLGALEADLLLPVRRDGALEALRAWRADSERSPDAASLAALLALHERLRSDTDAHLALGIAFEREAALLGLRAAARADDAAIAALLKAAASVRD
jgi:hypothetical protein